MVEYLCNNKTVVIFVFLMSDKTIPATKMSVQELPPNSTVLDLMERAGVSSPRWSPYSFPLKEELRPRVNHKPINDPNLKLSMGDVVELTPALPHKSLTEYREEIQRMYERGGFALATTRRS
jgi:hypothetical protein